MKKKLSKYHINFIMLQLIAFTFVCIIAFVDYFISYDFHIIKIGMKTFTIVIVVIYELIINFQYKKAKRNDEKVDEDKDKEDVGYNEQYLWFEIILFIDILIIVALISQFINSSVNIVIPLVLSFVFFYIISIIIKPYFGIKNTK